MIYRSGTVCECPKHFWPNLLKIRLEDRIRKAHYERHQLRVEARNMSCERTGIGTNSFVSDWKQRSDKANISSQKKGLKQWKDDNEANRQCVLSSMRRLPWSTALGAVGLQ